MPLLMFLTFLINPPLILLSLLISPLNLFLLNHKDLVEHYDLLKLELSLWSIRDRRWQKRMREVIGPLTIAILKHHSLLTGQPTTMKISLYAFLPSPRHHIISLDPITTPWVWIQTGGWFQMKVEMETLKAKHTWDLVKPPPGVNIMGLMWIYIWY